MIRPAAMEDHTNPGTCAYKSKYRLLQIGVAASLSLIVLFGTSVTRAEERKASPAYRLDVMDKIRLRVFEWRPTLDRVFDWGVVNDTYSIGPAGEISVPLIGSITARGKTTTELQEVLSQRITDLARTVTSPNISVEIAAYRPFYILGMVETPGEYSFRPNLTALQAVSIAGGFEKADETDERDLINALGQDRVASARYYALVAKRARIRSALDNQSTIRFPSFLSDQQLKDSESRVFNSERSSSQEVLRTMGKKKEYLKQAVKSLNDQLRNHDLERDLTKTELDKLEKLHSRKLVTTSRQIAARLNFYQLERIRIRTQSELHRTIQAVYEATAGIQAYKNERQEKLMVELNETELQIRLIQQQMRTTRNLITEATRKAPMVRLSQPDSNHVISYAITRVVDGQAKEMIADEKTLVQPGDILKVKLAKRNGSNPAKPKAHLTTLVR